MSEPTFPFEGQQAAETPAVEAEGSSNRKALLAVAGLGAAALLGLGGYFFLLSGGDDATNVAAPPHRSTATTQPTAPADKDTTKTQPKLSNKSFGRDPFRPLIVEPVAGPAAPGAPVPGAPVTGGTSTGGTVTVPGTVVPVASQAHTFQVVDVAPDNSTITVRVDGKKYRSLKAGEVFAKYFKVLVIGGQMNAFQFGDDKFSLTGKKAITIAP